MISNHSLEINRFKFSVVVPTYNEEKNIYKLIEALLSQKLLPDEIIISDGGSVDKTLDIVLNFIKKNDKIKILNRNGKCRGSGRNEGINYSKNNLIALIDSGTIPHKNWLYNFAVKLNQNSDFDVIFGSVHYYSLNFFDRSFEATFINRNKKIDYLMPTVASMFIQKKAWNKIGRFPESLDGSYVVEDLRFIEKIKSSDLIIEYLPSSKVNWIMNFSFNKIINRYYEYSLGGLKLGYYSTWHKGLVRNIFLMLFLIILSIKLSLFILILLLFLFLFKSYLYLRITKWFNKINFFKKFNYIFFTSIIFLLIDFSTFLGLLKWILLGFPKIKEKNFK